MMSELFEALYQDVALIMLSAAAFLWLQAYSPWKRSHGKNHKVFLDVAPALPAKQLSAPRSRGAAAGGGVDGEEEEEWMRYFTDTLDAPEPKGHRLAARPKTENVERKSRMNGAAEGKRIVEESSQDRLVDRSACDGLREVLQTVEHKERMNPGCVFIVRRIKRLGFNSPSILKKHFAAYGPVDSVVLAHTERRNMEDGNTFGRRPANVGFVVMKSASSVEAIFRDGAEHLVYEHLVVVQQFERQCREESREHKENVPPWRREKSHEHKEESSSAGGKENVPPGVFLPPPGLNDESPEDAVAKLDGIPDLDKIAGDIGKLMRLGKVAEAQALMQVALAA